MRKYQSDINRILSLIYDDQPIVPPQMVPAPFRRPPALSSYVKQPCPAPSSVRQSRPIQSSAGQPCPAPSSVRQSRPIQSSAGQPCPAPASARQSHPIQSSAGQPCPAPASVGQSRTAPASERQSRPIQSSARQSRTARSGPKCVDTAPALKVEINLGMLEGIRKAAAYTMDRLMTEEELMEEPAAAGLKEPEGKEIICSQDMQCAEPGQNKFGLSPTELELLKWLIKPEQFRRPETENLILSVIVDSINEKLYEEFADTVVENESVPKVIEDYQEELEKLIL